MYFVAPNARETSLHFGVCQLSEDADEEISEDCCKMLNRF